MLHMRSSMKAQLRAPVASSTSNSGSSTRSLQLLRFQPRKLGSSIAVVTAAASAGSSTVRGQRHQLQPQQQQQQQQQVLQADQQPKQDDDKQSNGKPPLDSFIPLGSSSSRKGSGSKGGPEEPPEPPSGPNLPPQLQQLLALLTEFGGKLGTAAVLIAWFTNIDPFGGLHWDQDQVLFGLGIFLPLMLFDAALMLPDYSISDPQQQRAVTGMFVGEPQTLSTPPTGSSSGGSAKEGSSSSSEPTANSGSSSSEAASDAEARRMADAIEAAAAAAAATSPGAPVVIMQQQPDGTTPTTTSSSSSSGGGGGAMSPLLRVRVALGLLQQVYTRANPGIGLSPAAEFVVVLVATLADEMLYRAVALTLLGLWLRDRLFEAGFDDDVTLDWLTALTGQAGQMPTSQYAQYLAVAVVAGLGVTGFAVGAVREVQALQKMQVIDKDGNASSAAAQALKSQLVSNLGTQNVTLYAVEGLREVTASIMAGFAFMSTHNLAASLAGSVLVQTLFSLYQRISLDRVRRKRQELRDKVMQRQQKLEAAMQAALAAKKAQDAAAAANTAAAEASAVASTSQQQGEQEEEEEVDFLTAVLRAAEQQQKQQQLEQQRQQQQASAGSLADSTPANWGHESVSADAPGGSGRDGPAAGVAASAGGSAAAAAAAAAAASPEVAAQQLAALLEDMLRSPEGNRVVQAWIARQDSSTRDSFASSSSSSSPEEAVDKLLSDPDTKAALLAELQEQLLGMSSDASRKQELEKL